MPNTTLFIETLKVENNTICNLDYHQARFNNTQLVKYDKDFNIDLKSYIDIPDNKLYRCKVKYSQNIESVHFFTYSVKRPKNIKIVNSNIEYSLKYADRVMFEKIQQQHPNSDEIAIIKNNLLTDTTIANIALLKNGTWYTPKQPLLKGTTRARLLENNKIVEKNIEVNTLFEYEKIALMNAMVNFLDLGKFKILNDEIIIED